MEEEAEVVVSAPGKVILFGEHAVVYGKAAIAASLSSLRTYASFRFSSSSSASSLPSSSSSSSSADLTVEFPDVPFLCRLRGDTLSQAAALFLPPSAAGEGVAVPTPSARPPGLSPPLTSAWSSHERDSVLARLKALVERDLPSPTTHIHNNHSHSGHPSAAESALLVLLFLYGALAATCIKEEAEAVETSSKEDEGAAEEDGAGGGAGVRRLRAVRIWSGVPLGAGLGSSAAFSVCCAAGLLRYFAHALLGLSPPCSSGGSSSSSPSSSTSEERQRQQLSAEALQVINQWALEAEKLIHGTPSGIDNTISTYGGALSFQRVPLKDGGMHLDMRPLGKIPRLRLLITNTNVPRRTSQLVAGVRVLHDSHPSIMIPILEAIHHITLSCLHEFQEYFKEDQDETQHQQHTNEGTKKKDDRLMNQLEQLIDMNQGLLQSMGVGHAKISQVCSIAAAHGFHAKLTGAGGGGCVFTLLPFSSSCSSCSSSPSTEEDAMEKEDGVEKRINELKKGMQAAFGEKGCFETEVGGHGVLFHS